MLLGIFNVIPSGFVIISMPFNVFVKNVEENKNFLLEKLWMPKA